jgi:hypothetical protein
MLAFTEILKNQMPKKKKKHKKKGFLIMEKLLDILLIIISVYIALFVESWAESRREHKRLTQYYENFVTEIKQDITELKNEEKDTQECIEKSKQIIKMTMKSPNSDSISIKFNGIIHATFLGQSNMLSYKSMVASGDLKLIEKLEIRQALTELDVSYVGLKLTEDLYLDYLTQNMMGYLYANFDMLTQKPIHRNYYKTTYFTNMVINSISHNTLRLKTYQETSKSAQKSLKLISHELEEMGK